MPDVDKHIDEQFLRMPLRPETMPFYIPRAAILAAVNDAVTDLSGVVLDVGCGVMPYRKLIESSAAVTKYIGMDIEGTELYGHVPRDLTWNGRDVPMDDESVDCVIATEFLEHYSDPTGVLTEIARVIKTGGRMFATVPFVWNLHEIPHDEYRYTPYSLERHFRDAGFKDIRIRALGGWNLSLAQMIGLWANFSKMSDRKRNLAKKILFPFYVWLIKNDKKLEGFDGLENSMFTGLSVMASK